ncbi:MAG TPA: hypothetical protein VHK67_06350 [Rhabdochlamydiaceae bacterium]|nr:hypothetical protein [Rhabdochlamydiaceae bacterium]
MSIFNRLGNALWSAPSAIGRGASAAVQAAVAAPGVLISGTTRVVGAVASAAARGGWNLTKATATGLGNLAVKGLTAGKDMAVAQSVQKSGELFFRIQSVAGKIVSDMTGILPPSQFNRYELAASLEAHIKLHPVEAEDHQFILDFCADLQNPAVIFDQTKNLQWKRLEKIFPTFPMPVSQVNRNELADRLEEFSELYRLKASDKKFILQLCSELRNVTAVFDQSKSDEMDQLEKILIPYFKDHSGYISSKVKEREELERLPGLTTAMVPQLTREATLEGIENQIDLLKSNAIKLVLGKIILNVTLDLYSFEKFDFDKLEINCDELGITPPAGKNTDIVNFLIEVSNKAHLEGKTSEEVFKVLLYRVIDNCGKTLFARTHAKLRCWFISDSIAKLIGNLIDNLKRALIHFAKLPPEKQLEELTVLFITPLLEHLTAIDKPGSGNPSPKTSDELLDKCIEAFLNQFLDRQYQPLTRRARAYCLDQAYRSKNIVRMGFIVLATLCWIAGKIVAPLQWAINELIHSVVKKIVIDLCPTLSSATKDALSIGKQHSWFQLKQSLRNLLQQLRLNALLPRTEGPSYAPAKEVPAEVRGKLTNTLDKLFKILATAEETQTPAETKPAMSTLYSAAKLLLPHGMIATDQQSDEKVMKELTSYLQHNLDLSGMSNLKDLIKIGVTELVLNLLAQDDCINTILLTSLKNTNLNSFAATSIQVTDAEKAHVEQDLHKELGLLGGKILEAVESSQRTDNKYPTYANIALNTLKKEAEKLEKELRQLHKNPDLTFSTAGLEACARFTESVQKLSKELTDTVDRATKAQVMPHFQNALDHVLRLSDSLAQKEIQKKQHQVKTKLDELFGYMAMPLDHTEEIERIFNDLRALKPSFLNVEEMAKHYQARLAKLKSRTRTSSFQTFVAIYQHRANEAAQQEINAYKPAKHELDNALAPLHQWAATLKMMKIKKKPGVADAGFAFLYSSPLVQGLTSTGLQSYGKNLFTFISNEKNLAAIVERSMEAYLNKPAMMQPKQRGKLDVFLVAPKVKTKPLSQSAIDDLSLRGWKAL